MYNKLIIQPKCESDLNPDSPRFVISKPLSPPNTEFYQKHVIVAFKFNLL